MTNPVNSGPNPADDPLGSTSGPAPAEMQQFMKQMENQGMKSQDWGPAWTQFKDMMGSSQNMAMFQKTLLNNIGNEIKENQNRYEANKQLLKELYPDLNQ